MSGCFIFITIHVGACGDVAYAPLERGVGKRPPLAGSVPTLDQCIPLSALCIIRIVK